jgi:hypothetical protein
MCDLLTRLRLALADKVEGILRDEFEEMWLDVVCAKPPWSDEDFLYVLHKHWRSVLQVGGRSALGRVLWSLSMSERINNMLQLLSGLSSVITGRACCVDTGLDCMCISSTCCR